MRRHWMAALCDPGFQQLGAPFSVEMYGTSWDVATNGHAILFVPGATWPERAERPKVEGLGEPTALEESLPVPSVLVDWAWAAGMFEGEGSVRINKPTQRNSGALLVDMVNTDESIVRWFGDRWGGYFRQGQLPGNRRPFWMWRIASHQAASFLQSIQPYVVGEKRARVALALEFQGQKLSCSTFNRQRQYLERQWSYYERMKDLNARGVRKGTQLRLLPSAETLPVIPLNRRARG